MKNQFKKLICVIFGHKMDYKLMNDQNIQGCFRCGDSRAFYYDGTNYWTDVEYYGLIGYPLLRIKNCIWDKWFWVKMKIGKPKTTNKDDEDDSVPF